MGLTNDFDKILEHVDIYAQKCMLNNSIISIGFSTYISYVLIVPGGALVSALVL